MKKIETISYLKKSNKSKPCWKGYKMIGTKNKNNKEVPNCVPDKEASKKNKYKYNPFAICTKNVGRKDKEKYERCVLDVKKKN